MRAPYLIWDAQAKGGRGDLEAHARDSTILEGIVSPQYASHADSKTTKVPFRGTHDLYVGRRHQRLSGAMLFTYVYLTYQYV